ncbi:MAG: HAMP domain-containing protein [bacterium]|nr:HAMP domain-containing protein [bacterium]
MRKLKNKIASMPFWNKLVSQFIFSHVMLASLSIAIVGIFLISGTNSYVRRKVRETNLEKVRNSASEISYYVNNTLNLLTFTAKLPRFFSQSFIQEQTLNQMALDFDYFNSICVVDTNLIVLSSTKIGESNNEYPDPEFYNEAAGKERHISQVLIVNTLPMIRVAFPINEFDNFVGLLIAEIRLHFIWELVDDLSGEIEDGMMYLVSSDGTVIAHQDRKIVWNRENYSKFPFISNLNTGNEGTDSYIDTEMNNLSMICAYTPVEELNWGVVIIQSEEKAFEVSSRMLNDFIFLIIGSIILASLIGIHITRNMAQPLKFLVEGVKRVSKGSLLETIKVPKTDELATLATEFNKMTENLLEIQTKLKQAERLATVSKFASVVAHEIRNPFNSIVINMQVLKRGMNKGDKREKVEKLMDVIDSEIRRIDGLIQNYLSLTRQREIRKEPVEINSVIDEVILSQHERAVKDKIKIKRNSDIESINIPVDSDQIKQAVLNIILNAFDSMPEGGDLTIGIMDKHDNAEHSDKIVLSFEDAGCGIPKENISEVFDFFYSLKHGGTGLGLAVTKQIINSHNGEIEIYSEVDKGTTVLVYLPIS